MAPAVAILAWCTAAPVTRSLPLDFGAYSVKVDAFGVVKDVSVDGRVWISLVHLIDTGNYEGRVGNTRVWQGEKEIEVAGGATSLERVDGGLRLTRSALVGNAQYPDFVAYRETLVLGTNGLLEFEYLLTMRQDVVYLSFAFPQIRVSLPMPALLDRPIRLVDKDEIPSLFTFIDDPKQMKGTRLPWVQAFDLLVAPLRILSIRSSFPTISVSDSRAWGGNDFDLRSSGPLPEWKEKFPVVRGATKKIDLSIQLPLARAAVVPALQEPAP
ncbi:MAG: hypothetical protein J0L75_07370 [Spirochaetes bacterium]|nr:hypothetical protein [Spirochaetota bacterium]